MTLSRARQLTSQDVKGYLPLARFHTLWISVALCAAALPSLAWAGQGGARASVSTAVDSTASTASLTVPLADANSDYAADALSPVHDTVPSAAKFSTPATSTENHSAKPVAQPPQHPAYISVQAGQTLWELAQTYHVSVGQLQQWNGLTDTSRLQIGQRLVLSREAVQAATARQVAQTSRRTTSRDGGATGYVTQPTTSSVGARAASYALRYLGVPYVVGGSSPRGFDCSGLVQYVYAMCGVSLPHYSGSQFGMGERVSRSALAPGDLVFFDTDGAGPSHVGIYIGGGRFVSAAGSAVRVDSLDNPYWAAHYIGARRIGR